MSACENMSIKFSKLHTVGLTLALVLVSVLLVIFTKVTVAQTGTSSVCTSDIDNKTDKELELALKACEDEIAEQKILLENKQRESVTVERDISILDYEIAKAKSEIASRQIKISKINKSIENKKVEILTLSDKTQSAQESLAELIRKSDEIESYSLVETLLSNESLSDFFIDVDNFDVIKKGLNEKLSDIRELKTKTEIAKAELEDENVRERGLNIAKEAERRKTALYQEEKKELLNLNRQEEKKYEQTIAEKERIKNEIRNRIFRTVGGTEMTFEEALKLILPFEERIGVEAALVLAVLTQESAIDGIIGSNLGRCTYNQPSSNNSGTVMSNSQKPSFLAITQELGLDPETTPVSCPIKSDGQYGGAMGPAQFMPSTWWDVGSGYGYKHRIAKVLGITTPSPFVNLDAFTGTALYLSDARQMCAGPKGFSNITEIWACSAAKYYSGLQSRGSRLSAHMDPTYSYGYKVARRALAFQKDIDLLEL